MAVDFYLLTDTIDINQNVIIDKGRLVFRYRFSSIALVRIYTWLLQVPSEHLTVLVGIPIDQTWIHPVELFNL